MSKNNNDNEKISLNNALNTTIIIFPTIRLQAKGENAPGHQLNDHGFVISVPVMSEGIFAK